MGPARPKIIFGKPTGTAGTTGTIEWVSNRPGRKSVEWNRTFYGVT